MNTQSIRSSIENRILHGLKSEWKTALWVLPDEISGKMIPPIFSLNGGKSRLACWKPATREIIFSRHFVLNYGWDSVKEVLLHEMAHQLVSEVLNIHTEPSHGHGFQKACHLLRANPAASGSYKPLSDRIIDKSENSTDRLLIKIKKLLALATSTNRHEAESAVSKAHELIEKHNINLIETTKERDFVSTFAGKPSLRHFKEEYMLASLLTTHYFVHGIWVSSYVIEKEKMGKVLELTGTYSNVRFAGYVFDFIKNYIDMTWRHYTTDKTLNRYQKSDYAAGVIEGFHLKLMKGQSSGTNKDYCTSTPTLPVKREDPILAEYVTYKYPSVKRFNKKIVSRDQTMINEGKKAGKKLVISKGITKKSYTPPLSIS